MTDDRPPDRFSLSRWSRRKLESARAASAAPGSDAPAPTSADPGSGVSPAAATTAPATTAPATSAPAATARAMTAQATVAAPLATSGAAAARPPLPPIDSLGIDADFTGFFKPDVAPSLRNAALKKLFADPRFNVMDGLDTYIDDYSVFVPLDAEEARGLVQARAILDPPKTRVNDQGHVEPVPPDEPAVGAPAVAEPAAEAVAKPSHEPGGAGVPAARDADRDGAGTPIAAPANPASVAAASPDAVPAPAPVPAPPPAVPEPSAAPPRGTLASRSPR
jgi:hypothetical protein